MIKVINILAILFLGFMSTNAQGDIILPNHSFSSFHYVPCPFDEQEEIYLPTNWEIYQTSNGQWDGPKDETRCIGLVYDTTYARIDLNTINPSLPLFVKAQLGDSIQIPVQSNWIYEPFLSHVLPDAPFLSNDIADQNCSELILNISHTFYGFDSITTYKIVAPAMRNSFHGCMITDYYPNQRIKDFIIKYEFAPQAHLADKEIQLNGIFIDAAWDVTQIEGSLGIPDWMYNGSTFEWHHPAGSNTLLIKASEEEGLSYIEVIPETDKTEQQRIDIFMNAYGHFDLAPQTTIIGQQLADNPPLRHEVNLIWEDGIYCLPDYSIPFEGTTSLVFEGGGIYFSGYNSGLYFSKEAALSVGKYNSLFYGNNGLGSLSLGEGGTIVLNENSQLTINNQLKLIDNRGTKDSQIYMDLPPNSQLSFGENASLTKEGTYAEEGYMQLNIFMNGGDLDDRNLNVDERKLINLIYPTSIDQLSDRIKLFSNPTSNSIDFQMTTDLDTAFSWELYNTKGQLIANNNITAFKGYSYHSISTTGYTHGLYFLKVSMGDEVEVLKIVLN